MEPPAFAERLQPHTGSMHQVEVPWEAGSGDEFGGGCLLQDGRVLLAPAGEAVVSGYNSCALLPDGRMLFMPWYSRHLVVWEPGLGASFGRDVALSGFWNRWQRDSR